MSRENQLPKIPKGSETPRRPSQDQVRENADKWAMSAGLQPPK
jgi:hypothetical protein